MLYHLTAHCVAVSEANHDIDEDESSEINHSLLHLCSTLQSSWLPYWQHTRTEVTQIVYQRAC